MEWAFDFVFIGKIYRGIQTWFFPSTRSRSSFTDVSGIDIPTVPKHQLPKVAPNIGVKNLIRTFVGIPPRQVL